MKLIIQEDFLRKVVYAVEKAIRDDIPHYLRENHYETNNALPHLRGDYINENLRRHVVGNGIELVPFKRYSWAGRIIIDRVNHLTYTITTFNTLVNIPKKKGRIKPHFLQSILYAENASCEAKIKQTKFDFGITQFESDELEQDYANISQGLININENYRHYVIAYQSEGNEINEIILRLLDKDFDTVDEASLMEYIKPDFARLTDMEFVEEEVEMSKEPDSENLVNIKAEVFVPNLRKIDKPADE